MWTEMKSNLVSKQKSRTFVFVFLNKHPPLAQQESTKNTQKLPLNQTIWRPKIKKIGVFFYLIKYSPIVPEKFSATMRSKRRLYLRGSPAKPSATKQRALFFPRSSRRHDEQATVLLAKFTGQHTGDQAAAFFLFFAKRTKDRKRGEERKRRERERRGKLKKGI